MKMYVNEKKWNTHRYEKYGKTYKMKYKIIDTQIGKFVKWKGTSYSKIIT